MGVGCVVHDARTEAAEFFCAVAGSQHERLVGQTQHAAIADTAPAEELLGAADIQSLADLGNSYALVREMRAIPFGLEDIARPAAATAAPLVPL